MHAQARDRIERAERLVHQQHRRPGDDRPRERSPVLHAARQLVRERIAESRQANGGPCARRQVAETCCPGTT
jgi:hypothetical protein